MPSIHSDVYDCDIVTVSARGVTVTVNRVYAKGRAFDFGILILKVNRTFVMKKITLRGPKLPRSSHPIVVLFRSNF